MNNNIVIEKITFVKNQLTDVNQIILLDSAITLLGQIDDDKQKVRAIFQRLNDYTMARLKQVPVPPYDWELIVGFAKELHKLGVYDIALQLSKVCKIGCTDVIARIQQIIMAARDRYDFNLFIF